MREQGLRTGLYTSPHLVTVRERMKINGQSISEEQFNNYFWQVYRILEAEQNYENDMPPYFQFLTIMMFHVFIKSSIDVAIIEVGIGGELDCTNIITQPICVGITKLDFDHMSLLGNTLSLIAKQKSGIFKENIPAFTVPQEFHALEVLKIQAIKKNCSLTIVPPISKYLFTKNPPLLGITADIQYYNASLAIQLASVWLINKMSNNNHEKIYNIDDFINANIAKFELALATCKWPGRTQLLSGKLINFYLDGAHTIESMKGCVNWFNQRTRESTKKRVLIFNVMGNRDSSLLLNILKPLNFDAAFFVPSISGNNMRADQDNKTTTLIEQLNRCAKNCEKWGENGICANSVSQAFALIDAHYNLKDNEQKQKINLLITGSLHLVGAALAILDPELTMKTNY